MTRLDEFIAALRRHRVLVWSAEGVLRHDCPEKPEPWEVAGGFQSESESDGLIGVVNAATRHCRFAWLLLDFLIGKAPRQTDRVLLAQLLVRMMQARLDLDVDYLEKVVERLLGLAKHWGLAEDILQPLKYGWQLVRLREVVLAKAPAQAPPEQPPAAGQPTAQSMPPAPSAEGHEQ
jgi:hypothetical protein